MYKLLVKLFIKDKENLESIKVRSKYGVLSGIVGIITNLILCAFKILTGVISGSVSMLADGINNLSDAGSSIVTLVGFKLSALPPDEKHPFGHERIEYISGMIVAMIILLIGFTLLKESIDKIINPEAIDVNHYLYIVIGIGLVLKLWLSLFNRKMAKDINSPTIHAASLDSLNDTIGTLAVLIGIIVYEIFNLNIDGYIGIFVSLFIFKAGYEIIKETSALLIGVAPSEQDVADVTEKLLSYENVLGIHDLVFHMYGSNRKFITVHCEVDADVNVLVSHDMMDIIENDFKKLYNIDLVIHMDPIDIHNPETIALKEMINELLNDYDEKLRMHDFRVVYGVSHTNLIFDVVIPFKYPLTPNQVKEEIKELVKQKNEKYEVVITIDQLYDFNK